jgi:hypothetical protein
MSDNIQEHFDDIQDERILDNTEYDPDEMRASMAYLESQGLTDTDRYRKLKYYFSQEFMEDCFDSAGFEAAMEKDD